ncbi:MAG: GerMN domain-containing protein [Treponema sp.]|jgi:hypothetical protein|nr:GerMN domain-containing protein [Treponema sp.]
MKQRLSPLPIRQKILFAVFAGLLAVSVYFYIHDRSGARRMFYFPSYDGVTLYTEVRFLPKAPAQGDIRLFVDELLLGPLTDRCRPLFSQGTRTLSCVQQAHTLYLDLSSEGFFSDGAAVPVREAVEILGKNIKANFPLLDTVEIFIAGVKVCDN